MVDKSDQKELPCLLINLKNNRKLFENIFLSVEHKKNNIEINQTPRTYSHIK